LLLQVVDYADENYKEMMSTTAKTLKEIGVGDIPMITIYNKADKIEGMSFPDRDGDTLTLSAQDDASLDMLIEVIRQHIYSDHVQTKVLIPFEQGQLVSELNEQASVHSIDYVEAGTMMDVTLTPVQAARFAAYVVD